MKSGVETYLARLRRELRKRGLADARIVEEVCGHLTDATEQEIRRGLSTDAAESEAIARFGSPKMVASNFASERYRMLNRLLLIVAVMSGIAIAYVDSRPGWDATGVTAFSLLLCAGVLGLIGPQRPWLWALAVGIWIPLHAVLRTPSVGSLLMLVVLAFPFAGAYAGMALRRVFTTVAAHGDPSSDFHVRDRAGRFHFAVKTKRGWVNPELLAIASDPDTQLVPFLQRVAPAPLGPLGAIQSVTRLEGGTAPTERIKRYRAVFGDDVRIVCTVTLSADGKGVSLDWSRSGRPKT